MPHKFANLKFLIECNQYTGNLAVGLDTQTSCSGICRLSHSSSTAGLVQSFGALLLWILFFCEIVCVCFCPAWLVFGLLRKSLCSGVCYYQVLGGVTVATRWQLSSPWGLESYNSQISGDMKVATLKSPGS